VPDAVTCEDGGDPCCETTSACLYNLATFFDADKGPKECQVCIANEGDPCTMHDTTPDCCGTMQCSGYDAAAVCEQQCVVDGNMCFNNGYPCCNGGCDPSIVPFARCNPNCVASDAACGLLPGSDPCCDPAHGCTTYTTSGGTTAVKCQGCAARGQACTTGGFSTDCCSNNDACTANVCTATCVDDGGACTTNGLACCNGGTCHDGTCQQCVADVDVCTTSGDPCCETDSLCGFAPAPAPSGRRCRACLAQGEACWAGGYGGACCGSLECDASNTCQPVCWPDGDACFLYKACCVGTQDCVLDGAPGTTTDQSCQECIPSGGACSTVFGTQRCCGDDACDASTNTCAPTCAYYKGTNNVGGGGGELCAAGDELLTEAKCLAFDNWLRNEGGLAAVGFGGYTMAGSMATNSNANQFHAEGCNVRYPDNGVVKVYFNPFANPSITYDTSMWAACGGPYC
jgi:DnaJ family protein A protein 1